MTSSGLNPRFYNRSDILLRVIFTCTELTVVFLKLVLFYRKQNSFGNTCHHQYLCFLVWRSRFEWPVYLKHGSSPNIPENLWSIVLCFLWVTSILFFLGVYIYHLRCYIYQARNLMALDKDSFSGKGGKNLHLTCYLRSWLAWFGFSSSACF